MADKTKAQIERDRRNKELAQKVKNGENLDANIDMRESWFPKRPIIEKDKKAVKKLFKE